VATAYAICAKGIVNEPLAQATAPFAPGPVPPPDNFYHWQVNGAVSCPQDQVLVGGGTNAINDDMPSTVAVVPPVLTAWSVGLKEAAPTDLYWAQFDTTHPLAATPIEGICVSVAAPQALKKNIYIALPDPRLPVPDDVLAATRGAPTTLTTHSVHLAKVASAPIAADVLAGATGRTYAVPRNCGDSSPAVSAATAALRQQVGTLVPAGQLAVGDPIFTFDTRSLTCSPAAGTSMSTPFTYTQFINGTVSQATINPLDVLTYQQRQLEQAAQQLGSGYVVRDAQVCPQGVRVVTASSSQATLSCPARGWGEIVPTTDQTDQLVKLLAGKSPSEAQVVLRQQPGFAAAVLTVEPSGTATLPADPSQITLTIVGEDQ
jgi:hypothetical protein